MDSAHWCSEPATGMSLGSGSPPAEATQAGVKVSIGVQAIAQSIHTKVSVSGAEQLLGLHSRVAECHKERLANNRTISFRGIESQAPTIFKGNGFSHHMGLHLKDGSLVVVSTPGLIDESDGNRNRRSNASVEG
uniref:Uncharacterized protein n=1 Tax=Eutreptiella gymnastica TaxID=73025 RepID=A0A7S4GLA9_9EUGL